MSEASPSTLGARIAEARTRAGLSQAELSSAVDLDRSALSKIENGTRRVSALELARIATRVGERIEWFLLSPPPSIVSHRNLQDPGAASPEIDRMTERVARAAEFVQRHDDQLTDAETPRWDRPRTVADTERVASKARALLGLDDSEPLLDLSGSVGDLGLLVFAFDLGVDAADAASILLRRGGIALINGERRVGRRRVAAIHELGHYLFGDEYTVDWRVSEHDDDAAWEARLDRFARAVLLPTVGIGRMWQELRRADGFRIAAVKAASAFRVDMSTLARRLRELGLAKPNEAAQIRLLRTTRADIVEHNLLIHDELCPPALPLRYEEAVLRLYRAEIVSTARAIDLLLDTWQEVDLPALPMLPEGAIWDFVS